MAETRAEALPRYLEAAMSILSHESPEHLRALQDRLCDLRAVVRVEGAPPFSICLGAGRPWVDRHLAQGDVEITMEDPALTDLLLGHLTIEEGVLDDRVFVRGRLDTLLKFLEGWAVWLHGAMRCRSMPAVHQQLLAKEVGRQVNHRPE